MYNVCERATCDGSNFDDANLTLANLELAQVCKLLIFTITLSITEFWVEISLTGPVSRILLSGKLVRRTFLNSTILLACCNALHTKLCKDFCLLNYCAQMWWETPDSTA